VDDFKIRTLDQSPAHSSEGENFDAEPTVNPTAKFSMTNKKPKLHQGRP